MSCTWTTVHVHELTSVVSLKPSLPLVRFCPHSAWPCLSPQCGRPLWMTPNSVTYLTVSCVTFAVSQLLSGAYLHVTIRSDFTLTHLSDDYIQLASFLCSPTPRYYDFLYSPHSQTCQSLLSSDTHTVQLNVFIHSFIHSFIRSFNVACLKSMLSMCEWWVVSCELEHRLWTHVQHVHSATERRLQLLSAAQYQSSDQIPLRDWKPPPGCWLELCLSYFMPKTLPVVSICWIDKLSENVSNHVQDIMIWKFSVGSFDFELWPWPHKMMNFGT